MKYALNDGTLNSPWPALVHAHWLGAQGPLPDWLVKFKQLCRIDILRQDHLGTTLVGELGVHDGELGYKYRAVSLDNMLLYAPSTDKFCIVPYRFFHHLYEAVPEEAKPAPKAVSEIEIKKWTDSLMTLVDRYAQACVDDSHEPFDLTSPRMRNDVLEIVEGLAQATAMLIEKAEGHG